MVFPARVLVLTFRRSLAYKLTSDYSKDLNGLVQRLGSSFQNYMCLDNNAIYDADLLVIQLDSLLKVAPRPYDVVIIDEVLSAVLHLSGATIRDHTGVISMLQNLLQRAQHVLLMDANADEMPAHKLICTLERILRTSAYWVRNDYIRPTNKGAVLHICSSSKSTQHSGFRSLAIDHVLQLIKQGKRVYAPCTTATHAKSLDLALKRLNKERSQQTPPLPPVEWKLIVGSSEEAVKREVYEDMDSLLRKVDVFVCSPSITAGPSFEREHFDHLVQLAENSGEHSCTVIAAIQQLRRVRQVSKAFDPTVNAITPTDMCMDIYVIDKLTVRQQAGPIVEDELRQFIQVRGWVRVCVGCWPCLGVK